MLSRSHAAHAAHSHWFEDLRVELGALARTATHAWHNAVTRRDPEPRRADRSPWDGGPRPLPRRDPAGSVWHRIDTMWRRHCSRQRIGRLDAMLLKDIGVSYAEAEAEANKPFWRA